MIYDFPKPSEPIRQGDIFVGLPRVEVSLQKLAIVDANGRTQEVTWSNLAEKCEELVAIVSVRPVSGIVITQDCDAVRDDDISLCEICSLEKIYPTVANAEKKLSAVVSILTQHARNSLKWFYLPPDEQLGFQGRWAVDFSITIRVPRKHIEELRGQRRGRLNRIAYEHFREKLSEYFRRYPYDEWYPLNQEEFMNYQQKYPDTKPFPWQQGGKTE